mgnify:CR=1 FL=1
MRVHQKSYPKRIDTNPADRSSANYYRNARAMEDHGYVETPDSIQGGKSHYALKNGKTFTGKSGLSKSEVENAIRLEEKYAAPKAVSGQDPPSVPEIRKSLEYHVTLQGDKVVKEPNAGFGFKVESDYNKFEALGDLAPKTEYDSSNNRLVQQAVKGRFATEEELPSVEKKIQEKGFIPRGLLTHDVIIQSNGEPKVVDVGNFERMNSKRIKDSEIGDQVIRHSAKGDIEMKVVDVRHEQEFGKPITFFVLEAPNGVHITTDEQHLEMNYSRA